MAAGTDASSTLAPAAASASAASRTRAATSGAMPSPSSSVITPTRRPSTPSSRTVRETAGAGSGIDVESSGSWPAMTSSSSAASATVVANGPIWSRLRRERDQAVAADPAVGRLHADHAAQRRGLADRAAGVGAERRAARSPAATAAALPPDDPPGTRVGVVRVAGGAEGRVLGRRAHGELVEVGLADRRPRRRRARRSTTVASYGGSQPSRIRDEQVVGMPRVQRLSFSAIGHAGERAGVVARGDRARRRRRRRRGPRRR